MNNADVDAAIARIIYELSYPHQAQPNPWDDTVEDLIARYFAGFATEAQAIARLQVYIDNERDKAVEEARLPPPELNVQSPQPVRPTQAQEPHPLFVSFIKNCIKIND